MRKNVFNTLLHQFVKTKRKELFLILILGVFTGIITVLLPVGVGKFFELLLGISSTKSKILSFLPYSWTYSLPAFLLFMTVLIFLKLLTQFLCNYWQKIFTEAFLTNLKNRLYSRQLRVHPSVYEKSGMNKYLLRYSGDFASIRALISQGLLGFTIDLIIVVLALLMLAYIEVKATLILLSLFFISSLVLFYLSKKIQLLTRHKRNKLSGQLSFTASSFQALNTLHLFNIDFKNKKKYYKRSQDILDNSIRLSLFESLNLSLVSFLQYSILIIIFLYFWKSNSTIALRSHSGNIIAYILLYLTSIPFITRLLKTPVIRQKARVSIDKINQIFEMQVFDKKEGEVLVTKNPRLELAGFAVNGSSSLDFVSSKGSIKQIELPANLDFLTLSKCMLKIIENYEGQILINEMDIKSFSPKSLRANISVVSTQYKLYGKSLEEAMLTGGSNKSDLRSFWFEVNEKLNINDPIPLNYGIGEYGNKLNALQYEVACLVRGLFHNGNIVLVDRLAHLEKYNHKALKELLTNGKTVIRIRNANAFQSAETVID